MLETANEGHQRSMWGRIVAFLLVGYFCMGRSFAYLGIPPVHLFIGEITLGLFLVFGPRGPRGCWIRLAMKSPVLHHYKRILVVFLIFGLLQFIRGILSGYSPLLAARDLALNYYPFYFFLGLWAGLQDTEFLPKIIRFSAWANGIYGTLYILVLNRISWSFPGFSKVSEPVLIFGPPEFSAIILLGLVSFEKDLRRDWPLLLLNAFVLLGMLIRAEWVAFVLGIAVWTSLTKNLKKIALAGATVVTLLVVMLLSNFSIPGPETRGGTISVAEVFARVMAPFSKDVAAEYSSDSTDLRMYEANAVWRTLFWAEIWTSVHEESSRALFGYGYGYPLNELVPELAGDATRTPHNLFFYVLAYTGWVGIVIFAAFQAALVGLLWKLYRVKGKAFGIIFWVAMIVFSLFTPFFEVPQGAVPFYLLAGCACAGLLHVSKQVQDVLTARRAPHRVLMRA